jgi:hypothetical protein
VVSGRPSHGRRTLAGKDHARVQIVKQIDPPYFDSSKGVPEEYAFELPIEPDYRERPPEGSWEAGYRLSLMALEIVKNRPEVFEERDKCMRSVEFCM